MQSLGFGFCFGKRIEFNRSFYLLWRQQEYLRFKAMVFLDCGSDFVRQQRGILFLVVKDCITALDIRACANRRATFRTWHLSEGLNSLLTTAWHIRYSPIGAASKS